MLLLQREGAATAVQALLPTWLQEMLNARGAVRERLWSSAFIQLLPWADRRMIQAVMRSYAEHRGRAGALDACLDDLCETVRNKDERLLLPLFAMFVADAWLEGNDPCQWDAQQLLTCFCQRERDLLLLQLQGVAPGLEAAIDSYEALLVLSTITNGWKAPAEPANTFEPYQNFWHSMRETLNPLPPRSTRA